MPRALIFNEEYFALDNHDYASERYITEDIPFEVTLVGSFGKKMPEELSKDLDYVTDLSATDITSHLDDLGKLYYHYSGLRTISTTFDDINGIPRKCDFFYVDDYEFAVRGYYSHRFSETAYPSSALPMLLTNMAKASFNEEYGHVSYSPATGLRKKIADKQWEHLTLDFDELLSILKIDNSFQPTVEDCLAAINANWSLEEKSKLAEYLEEDVKFNRYLEEKGTSMNAVYREFLREAL